MRWKGKDKGDGDGLKDVTTLAKKAPLQFGKKTAPPKKRKGGPS